jgi:predicted transcriptional regulator of viral defense system
MVTGTITPTERRLLEGLRRRERSFVDLRRDREWLADLSADPVSLMYRMRKKGLAHQLQAGRYAINVRGEPSPFPILTSLDELAPALMDRLGGDYFLSWQSGLWYHGLIDQQSQRLFVAVRKQKRPARIGRLQVRFVRIAAHKFFGFEAVPAEGTQLRVASLEKTILDSFDLPQYAAPMPLIAEALRVAHGEGRLDVERLVQMALVFRAPSLNRRLGFFLEFYGIEGAEPLLGHLGRDWAIPLAPGARVDAEATPIDPRWRVARDPAVLVPAERRR